MKTITLTEELFKKCLADSVVAILEGIHQLPDQFGALAKDPIQRRSYGQAYADQYYAHIKAANTVTSMVQ